jgi:branched-chain amino acid transport system permease protein
MNYWATLVIIWCIAVIAAMSLNVIMGYAGQLFVAQGALVGVGAYTYARLTTSLHVNPWICLVAAIILGGIVGALFALGSLRMVGYDYVLFALIAQLVLTEVATGWTTVTGGATGLTNIPRPAIGSFSFDGPRSFAGLCLALCALTGLALVLVTRSLGLTFRSFRESERGTAALGKNVLQLRVVVGLIAGCGAGLAGALNATFVNFVQPPDYGVALSIVLVIYVMVGGTGNLLGSAFGVAIIMVIPQVISKFNNVQLTLRGPLAQMIYGAVIIGFVLLRPQGLVPERPLLNSRRVRDDAPTPAAVEMREPEAAA